MAFCLIFFAAGGLRLACVQITYADQIKELDCFNNVRTGTIAASRGRIYDAHGNPLADNRIVYELFVNPSLVKDEQRPNLIRELTGNFPCDPDEVGRAIRETNATYRTLIGEMTSEEVEKFNALTESGPLVELMREVGIMKREARVYPLGPLAGPVIGFTGTRDSGQVGLWGLESSYNNVLSGRDGRYEDIRDQRGQRIPGSRREIAPPRNGSDLVLTLDADIQALAESALERGIRRKNALGGIVVITEPSTGNILALVSLPALDPSNPGESWENETARFSGSTCLSYEPGSVLKIFTAAAAIEEDLIVPDTKFEVGLGPIYYSGKPIPDHEYEFPVFDLEYAIVHSSNRALAMVAVDYLGRELLVDYLHEFGFGSVTNLNMPAEPRGSLKENTGHLPDIDLANMGFGHGIAVSPLQIVQAMSVFANDGVLVPIRLIDVRRDPPWDAETAGSEASPRRVISHETNEIMQNFMLGVVEEGTAMDAKTHWPCAGKTGTAQQVNPETGLYYSDKFYASFAGYGPVPNPKWLILVILDDPEWL